MKRHRLLGFALAFALVPARVAAQDSTLAWLVGEWRTDDADGKWTREHWYAMQDGVMFGWSRSGHGDDVSESEVEQISTRSDPAIFTASPDEQPEASFTEVSRGPRAIAFENAAHDYPQRVRYWRDGDDLMAEISLKDGSKPIQWRYHRATDDRALLREESFAAAMKRCHGRYAMMLNDQVIRFSGLYSTETPLPDYEPETRCLENLLRTPLGEVTFVIG